MTFTSSTSPSEDIILQEGAFAYDFECSGTVYKGQAVEAVPKTSGDIAVRAVPHNSKIGHGCVGVAAYYQTNGNPIAVYGHGNICRVIVSGSSKATCGSTMHSTYDGKWVDMSGNPGYLASGVNAIALETQATADGTVKVMLW